MYIINFSHPIAEDALHAIKAHVGSEITVLPVDVHVDRSISVSEHAVRIVAAVPLTAEQWQTESLAIIPPGLSVLACTVLTEIHGRAGYFVPLVVMRPVAQSVPPRFEFHQIIDLFSQREHARQHRYKPVADGASSHDTTN